MASVAALAALDPQLTPDGAALVALVEGSHRQALCWAALVTLVAPDTAPLAALGPQLTPAGVALACRWWHLGHQLVTPGNAPVVLRQLWLNRQQASGETFPSVTLEPGAGEAVKSPPLIRGTLPGPWAPSPREQFQQHLAPHP